MTQTETTLQQRLEELDKLLPPAPKPVGTYVPCVQTGNLVFTSGVLPLVEGTLAYTGAIGGITNSVETGQAAARACLLNALSVIKAQIGDLSKITRVVKLNGYVSSAPDFYEQPTVINGASNYLVEIFGEAGRHARAAIGVNALPMNASVELDLVVEISQ